MAGGSASWPGSRRGSGWASGCYVAVRASAADGRRLRRRAPAPDLPRPRSPCSSPAPSPARRSDSSSDRGSSWLCPRGRAAPSTARAGPWPVVLGVLVVVWLLSPLAAEITGWPADQVRNSSITRTVDRVFPSAPDPLRTLRQVIGEDRFPQVFEALRPTPDPGAPPAETGIDRGGSDRVVASTVKVEAAACGRLQDGSGAVVGDGLIVTNAHVVAGAEQVGVFRGDDGQPVRAEVVAFDPDRDLRHPEGRRHRPPRAAHRRHRGGRSPVRSSGTRAVETSTSRRSRSASGSTPTGPTSTTAAPRSATCSSWPPSSVRETRVGRW